jgi:hypothetical protein
VGRIALLFSLTWIIGLTEPILTIFGRSPNPLHFHIPRGTLRSPSRPQSKSLI